MKIHLNTIIDAIMAGNWQNLYYLNAKTGEIVLDPQEVEGQAREEIEDLLDDIWQDLLEIPNLYDIDDYQMMWDFTRQVDKACIRDQLAFSLQGKHALSQFRKTCQQYDLFEAWLAYQKHQISSFARDWCEENDLTWQEDATNEPPEKN